MKTEIYGPESNEVVVSLTVILLLFSFVIFVANGHLILFHIYVRCHNMTTYEWIMERKAKKFMKEINQEPERIEEIASANTSDFIDVPDESNHIDTKIQDKYRITEAKNGKKI